MRKLFLSLVVLTIALVSCEPEKDAQEEQLEVQVSNHEGYKCPPPPSKKPSNIKPN